jgi:hypothetical protein
MKFKGMSILAGFVLTCLASIAIYAATPTDINYCERGKTFTGAKYTTYTVRCSNGAKRKITAWNNRKKWCVGDASKRNCTSDQLQAAKRACMR